MSVQFDIGRFLADVLPGWGLLGIDAEMDAEGKIKTELHIGRTGDGGEPPSKRENGIICEALRANLFAASLLDIIDGDATAPIMHFNITYHYNPK